jgi:tetratricopeptide (TPR) repeat protein
MTDSGQLKDIESELKLLRDQVDLLQIAASEKKKPWYRQTSSIISIVALLFSIITGIYTQIARHEQEIRSQKDELRKTLATLLDLREDLNGRINSIPDAQMRESASISLNNKRMVYLEAAEFLITKMPGQVSSSECNVLANEHLMDSNFAQAERYFLKAIDASGTDINKVTALRALAWFYFYDGPRRDFEKGREYFEKAIEVLTNPTDAYSIFTLGYTYEQWGLIEISNGFEEGHQKIERARKYYSDLPGNFSLRTQSLELLDGKVKKATPQ